MKRLLTAIAVVLAMALTACAGPAVTDPYQLTTNALERDYQRVQLNIGFGVSGPGQKIVLTPDMVRVVVDTAEEKMLLTVRAPLEAFGASRRDLAAMGVFVDQVELDVLFDSQDLYARMPVAAPFLGMIFGQLGAPVEADLEGWLRLASKEDLEELGQMGGPIDPVAPVPPMEPPDFAAFDDLDAAALQQKLEDSGIVLNYEGRVTHDGAEADHVTLSIDFAAFAANPPFEGMDSRALADAGRNLVAADAEFWLDPQTGRLLELVVRGTSAQPDEQSFEMVVKVSEPDPSISLEPPATFVDLPVIEFYRQFLPGMFGG